MKTLRRGESIGADGLLRCAMPLGRIPAPSPDLSEVTVSDSVRKECEKELRLAAMRGWTLNE